MSISNYLTNRAGLFVASAHGRFQPLHNGHLEYLLAAKNRCDFLIVGLTQIAHEDLVSVPGSSPHRSRAIDNPLTYFERSVLVTEALRAAGVGLDNFAIVPFPIESPESLYQFLPLTVPIYTTVYESWNRQKIEILTEAGYNVEVLWERAVKEFEGSDVRSSLLLGDEQYLRMVPAAIVPLLEKMHLAERLRRAVGAGP